MLETIEFENGRAQRGNGSVAARLLESDFNPHVLRPNDVLRNREWILVDQKVTEIYTQRLTAVADLINAGLVTNVENPLGTTVVEFERQSDMSDAEVNMSGISEGEQDRPAYSLDSVALPIIHKDFSFNIRALNSSRKLGIPLDTTAATIATRKVAEKAEDMIFVGDGYITETGRATTGHIYGYTTHPGRHTGGFGTNGAWDQVAKTGSDILADVLTILTALRADRRYGPFWVYVAPQFESKLDDDFKALSTITIRDRLLAIDAITNIRVADRMPASTVVVVDAAEDTVDLMLGFMPMTVQWETEGGMKVNFKVMSIMAPRIKTDFQGRCGIYNMS